MALRLALDYYGAGITTTKINLLNLLSILVIVICRLL